MNKSAFIASILTQFWSYILIIVIMVTFAGLFKVEVMIREDSLSDFKGLTDGNYLSQVYLRMPVLVEDTVVTMGDYIIIYDYLASGKDKSKIRQFFDKATYYSGIKDPIYLNLEELTETYLEQHVSDDVCYILGVVGNDFEFSQTSLACELSISIALSTFFDFYKGIPEEAYMTYLPPIDPTKENIKVYFIYDLENMLETYASDYYSESLKDMAKRMKLLSCAKEPSVLSADCRAVMPELIALGLVSK